jgi:ribonuclease PH
MTHELRPIKITKNYISHAEGSCLFEMGNTKVLSTATIIYGSVPPHAEIEKIGWITAEYSMLPRSTKQRTHRTKILSGGRTHEIQRMIGRSLRSVVDLSKIPDMTIFLDCDVLQADGGTRTASVNGAFVAMCEALSKISPKGEPFVKSYLGAVSVGIVEGKYILDLTAQQDNIADVDMNVVMLDTGEIVEIQATAERVPFSNYQLQELLNLAESGIKEIIEKIKIEIPLLP